VVPVEPQVVPESIWDLSAPKAIEPRTEAAGSADPRAAAEEVELVDRATLRVGAVAEGEGKVASAVHPGWVVEVGEARSAFSSPREPSSSGITRS